MPGCDDWGDETNSVLVTNRDYWDTNLIARGALSLRASPSAAYRVSLTIDCRDLGEPLRTKQLSTCELWTLTG